MLERFRKSRYIPLPATGVASKYFRGWRFNLACCTGVAATVVFLNILFLLVAWPRLIQPPDEVQSPEGALYVGNCEKAKQMSVWLHLAINLLSTALLATSNYTQQVLTAPTRREIDRAHKRGQWLDVGVSSVHNLTRISRKRLTAWALLSLSSIPIHLFYNAVVSLESNTNAIHIFATDYDNLVSSNYTADNESFGEMRAQLQDFERLENRECIMQYAVDILSDRSHLFVVTKDMQSPRGLYIDSNLFRDRYSSLWMGINNNGLYNETGEPEPLPNAAYPFEGSIPFDAATAEVSTIEQAANNWTFNTSKVQEAENGPNWGRPDTVVVVGDEYFNLNGSTPIRVDYCLSKKSQKHCRLVFSVPLLALVVACNALKVIGLAVTWLCLDQRPLLTLGDAVASFLDRPDDTTRGLCLLSKAPPALPQFPEKPDSVVWEAEKRSWAALISARMYGTIIGFCIYILFLSIPTLISLINMLPIGQRNMGRIWNDGLGRMNMGRVFEPSRGGYGSGKSAGPGTTTALLSNLPQLLVSMLYIGINAIWTSMLAEQEWNNYAITRKGLRTSLPVGEQRTTHFISLPFKFGIPLLVMSALLHWLVSQAFFLVRLVIYMDDKPAPPPVGRTIMGIAYSNLGLILVVVCGLLLTLVTIGFSAKQFKVRIPGGGTCSAVISAACHPPVEDHDAAEKPVRWGVVASDLRSDVFHCSFTSKEVEEPEPGRAYR